VKLGEAKRKARSHRDLLEAHPFCIFCGGTSLATTIEHTPPRVMFRGKQRPNELIFPSCQSCNSGTARSDLVASLLGRTYPNADAIDEADLKKVLAAVKNNVPGLLEEMRVSDAKQIRGRRQMPGMPADGWLLRADGPILTAHMTAFGAKLGLALHFEAHERAVPNSGGVQPIWFSNAQAVRARFPLICSRCFPSRAR
jgi:hypothetical protein